MTLKLYTTLVIVIGAWFTFLGCLGVYYHITINTPSNISAALIVFGLIAGPGMILISTGIVSKIDLRITPSSRRAELTKKPIKQD